MAAFAATWDNIAAHMQGVSDELLRTLADLDDQHGQFFDTYRKFQGENAAHAAAGRLASAMGVGMQIASTIANIVHDMTRDALTQLAGTAISAATTAAIAIGFGTPWAVAQVATRVSALSARVGKYVTKLVHAIKELLPRLEDPARLFRSLRKALDEALESGKGALRTAVRNSDHIRDALPPGNRFGPNDARGLPVDVRDRVHTNLTGTELDNYLKTSATPEQYNRYLETGQWPDNVPIVVDPSVLDANLKYDWHQVPQGGYTLDAAGRPIKVPHDPQPGDLIDRYGNDTGADFSSVVDGKPFSYEKRSLPYAEDAAAYHQHRVERPFSEIPNAIRELPDGDFKDEMLDILDDANGESRVGAGTVAPAFVGQPGGAVQYESAFSGRRLQGLGIIAEVPQ